MSKVTLAAVGDMSFCDLPEQLFNADKQTDFLPKLKMI